MKNEENTPEAQAAQRHVEHANQQAAQAIREQVGHRAFTMMGTRAIVNTQGGIQFDVHGSRNVSKVRIVLDWGTDTYTVSFYKISNRGLDVKTVAEVELVQASQLRSVIDNRTGLTLSL